MSTLDHTLKPEATEVHRLEVITGTGRRRRFSEDFKAQIVEKTLVVGAVVSEVARRRGLTPQQVFTWRRQARRSAAGTTENAAPNFVPAVVVETAPPLHRHLPLRLILEIDVRERLNAGVVNDEAFAVLLDGPRRRLTCSAIEHCNPPSVC